MSQANRWHEENQRSLTAALARVRAALERHVAVAKGGEAVPELAEGDISEGGSALDHLCRVFGLSAFERDTLMLCAGMELSAGWAALCASAQGDAARAYPTFSLALAALPDAHWNALAPTAPLRRARLIDLGSGGALTSAPIQIQERVLHFLTGVESPEERLAGMIEPVRRAGDLVPSHQALVDQIVAAWTASNGGDVLPVIQLCGDDRDAKFAVAHAAAIAVGRTLSVIAPDALPASLGDWEPILRLWEREAALSGGALLVDCDDLDGSETARGAAVTRLIERAPGIVFVAARERRTLRVRPAVSFDVRKPTVDEQRALWRGALGDAYALNGHVELLTSQFDIGARTIRTASASALAQIGAAVDADPAAIKQALWDACRTQARPRLDDLAQRIEGSACWDDLVLPEAQRLILRDIAAHVRQRATVYETWGFAAQGTRGLGVSALFAGSSGTGKTMAAEVIARELRLDLYRIDLSSVVSKYIGETEKNLKRVFDAAEEGGAVLLFDEADALFGKRSEVKDSHDRYANIEVSYLLQRMESYRGLAILTTNLQSSLDTAFLRRLRFVVQFPFPDPVQRAEIWRRVFPAGAPTEGLDAQKLARLTMAGGNIRNIALNAAFLAADEGTPIGMAHALRAAQSEYAKLDKTLTDSEVAGWV
ncbi:ATPase [Capsulimonas corticalis]|uniref:ATPase n=1 Tax=Capsulimonas corticalis TaxID=2219043 RepID=A0A402CWR0_9BACT|nr:ATP-binding protein [Capsulimonas corticalis]BDI34259.1 ATPase [Capsulimonas corticalis]